MVILVDESDDAYLITYTPGTGISIIVVNYLHVS